MYSRGLFLRRETGVLQVWLWVGGGAHQRNGGWCAHRQSAKEIIMVKAFALAIALERVLKSVYVDLIYNLQVLTRI